MGETLHEDLFAMSQAFFSSTQLVLNLLQVLTTNIFEFTSFEQIPDAFLGIEFGRISRQTLEMDALGSTSRQEVFDRLTAMNRGSIPDDQQLARDLTQEHLQEAHDVRSLIGVILGLQEDPPLGSDGSHGREMVTSQLHRQDRRLPARGIGTYQHGQQIKAGFVYEDNRASFIFGFFLTHPSAASSM